MSIHSVAMKFIPYSSISIYMTKQKYGKTLKMKRKKPFQFIINCFSIIEYTILKHCSCLM